MNCAQIKKIISIYIDGELDNQQKEFLNTHLKACPNCQKIYNGYLKTWQSLEKFSSIDAPSNFNALFWERVKQQEKEKLSVPPTPLFPIFNRRLAYALASVIIILSLTFTFQISQDKELNKLARSFKSAEEIEMVKHFEVLKDLEVVQNLDLLENYEVIQNLEETAAI
jgi:hypothetical protein